MTRSNNRTGGINRNDIAKRTFAAAEAAGISDRDYIERLVSRVIRRLEEEQARREQASADAVRAFPGMEAMIAPAPVKRASVLDLNVDEILKEIMETIDQAEARAAPEEPIAAAAPEPAPPAPEAAAEETATEAQEVRPVVQHNVTSSSTSRDTLNLTENARHVLERRYLKKDKQGNIVETAEEMFHRVARAIAAAETAFDAQADVDACEAEFYDLMTSLKFLPNSPTLMNAGRDLGQLSACFVLPVDDDMTSIFDAVKYTALIHQSGGGTGFSFSRLRPESDRVGSTGGVASGPISFMKVFDSATDVIKQGGMRRGANMAILRVDHPDIKNFITAKEDMVSLTNFNLSVALTDRFMEALKGGTDYDLINPRTKEVDGTLNAPEVFKMIVDNAWATGDPGVVFIDEINRGNPTPALGEIESTNPCGEQPLLPFESCNLGSVNLALMLKEHDGNQVLDETELKRVVTAAVRFLDNVIEVNNFPLDQIRDMTRQTRKIGLGVMGFADMLLQMGIPYNSEAALDEAKHVMQIVQVTAGKASEELAGQRGVFPAWDGSIYNEPPRNVKMRNATRTTIAPTGTLSLIAGCSSGIEPLFALSFTRNILDGAQLVEVNPVFEAAAQGGGYYSDDLMQRLAAGEHLEDIDGVPDEVKRVFVTAHQISPEWHINMQAAFQSQTNNAVSKTINFPADATRDDIAKAYRMSHEEGLKGVTIYRDGCRAGQVLTTGKQETAPAEPELEPAYRPPRSRAKVTTGITERVRTGCGWIYVTVNSDEEGICEVFATLGKTGGCALSHLESMSRLLSLSLRAGIDIGDIVRQMRGIRCPSVAWEEGKSILSCADAIASVLEKHTTGYDGKPKAEDYGLAKNIAGQCPECTTLLVYQEGCFICPGCGYTKC